MGDQRAEIAGILASGWVRLQKAAKPLEPRAQALGESFPLAIPSIRSDESNPGLNSPSPLPERGSDV